MELKLPNSLLNNPWKEDLGYWTEQHETHEVFHPKRTWKEKEQEYKAPTVVCSQSTAPTFYKWNLSARHQILAGGSNPKILLSVSPTCTVPGHLPSACLLFSPTSPNPHNPLHLHLQHKAHSAEPKGALNLVESLYTHTHKSSYFCKKWFLQTLCKCKHSPVASRQSQISKEPLCYRVNLLSDWN